MNKKLKSFLQFAFFLGIGLLLVWLSLKDVTAKDKEEILYAITHADYRWLFVSLFIAVLSHLSRAMRWKLLLAPMGYKPSTTNSFFAVMIGYFANLALYRMGEVSRCGVLYQYEGIPIQKSLGTVVVERAVDMLCLGIVVFLSFVFHYQILAEKVNEIAGGIGSKVDALLGETLILSLVAIVGICLVLGLFFLRKKIKQLSFYGKIVDFLKGLLEGLKTIGKLEHPVLFILHSIFIWGMYLLMIYLCFFCFVETSHLGLDVGVSALAYGSFGMIATQGGVGAYPLVIEKLMMLFDISANMGKALGWLVWTAQTIMMVVFGFLSLLLLPVFNKKVNGEPARNITTEDA